MNKKSHRNCYLMMIIIKKYVRIQDKIVTFINQKIFNFNKDQKRYQILNKLLIKKFNLFLLNLSLKYIIK